MTDIFFNEAEHKYYDANGSNYTSVTTLIGKYTEEFDKEFWGMYKALQANGYKVKPEPEKQIIIISGVKYKLADCFKDSLFKCWYDEIIAKWNTINQEACIRGNETHNALEDNINISKGDFTGLTNASIIPKGKKVLDTLHDLDKTNLQEKYPFVYKRLSGFLERGCSIFAEKRVFLREYFIAGMIDVPIFKGNTFCILDWKTNKDTLHTTAGYYKQKNIGGVMVKTKEWIPTGKKFKYPLDMLEASKFNIYALQLSLYAYILEQWGYTLADRGLEIIHFPLGEEPRLLKIPYLKEEVCIMLNHHKQTTLLAS